MSTADVRTVSYNRLINILSKAGVYFIILLLFIVGIFVNKNFLTVNNLKNVLIACAQLGIVCAGMGFVTHSGKMVDMSAPIIIAITGIVAIDTLYIGVPQALLFGALAAVSIGLINGVIIGKFKANPIIWTLSMNFLLDGLIRWLYSNKQIYPDTAAADFPERAEAFVQIARTDLLGVPLAVWAMLIMMLASQFVMTRTAYGKQLKVIGSSADVAKYSGIHITRNIVVAYALSAFCAGVAGIFITSLGKVGAYYNGTGYEFQAATAIVLGGMSLSGGRGDMAGVLGGVITVKLMSNILTFLGIGTFVQNIVTGIIFILIVFVHSQSLRKLGRDNG